MNKFAIIVCLIGYTINTNITVCAGKQSTDMPQNPDQMTNQPYPSVLSENNADQKNESSDPTRPNMERRRIALPRNVQKGNLLPIRLPGKAGWAVLIEFIQKILSGIVTKINQRDS